MTLGVDVTQRTAPPARGDVLVSNDRLFVAGKSPTGPFDKASVVRSIGAHESLYGARVNANRRMYDVVDAFFREGGREVVVGNYASAVDDALALFTDRYGPGQVVATDETPGAATYGKLLDHGAASGDRFALLDVPLGATKADLQTFGADIPASHVDYGMLFGSWLDVPAPAGTIGGGTRQIPGSGVAAALMARADRLGNPNRAAAGRDFPLQYATAIEGPDYTLTDADGLLDSGVNLFLDRYGVLQLYGFQTGLAQTDDNPYWQANCSRFRAWAVAQAKEIGERYMFKPLDGQHRLARALQTDLSAMLLGAYNVDALYGNTPGEAFAVEVGVSVNDDSTVAKGELHAVAEIRPSLHAKSVQIELVSVPITGLVSTP